MTTLFIITQNNKESPPSTVSNHKTPIQGNLVKEGNVHRATKQSGKSTCLQSKRSQSRKATTVFLSIWYSQERNTKKTAKKSAILT